MTKVAVPHHHHRTHHHHHHHNTHHHHHTHTRDAPYSDGDVETAESSTATAHKDSDSAASRGGQPNLDWTQ